MLSVYSVSGEATLRLRCDCLGEELYFIDFVKVMTLSLHRYGRKTEKSGKTASTEGIRKLQAKLKWTQEELEAQRAAERQQQLQVRWEKHSQGDSVLDQAHGP